MSSDTPAPASGNGASAPAEAAEDVRPRSSSTPSTSRTCRSKCRARRASSARCSSGRPRSPSRWTSRRATSRATIYEVVLDIRADCKSGDAVAFILELSYGGVFTLNIPAENVRPMLLIECPRMLFPFARQILASTTLNGGFLPLMLGPVDFAVALPEARTGEASAGRDHDGLSPRRRRRQAFDQAAAARGDRLTAVRDAHTASGMALTKAPWAASSSAVGRTIFGVHADGSMPGSRRVTAETSPDPAPGRPAAPDRPGRAARRPSARRAGHDRCCRSESAGTARRGWPVRRETCGGPACTVSIDRSAGSGWTAQPVQLGVEKAHVEGGVVDHQRRVADEGPETRRRSRRRRGLSARNAVDSPWTAKASAGMSALRIDVDGGRCVPVGTWLSSSTQPISTIAIAGGRIETGRFGVEDDFTHQPMSTS